SALMAGTYKYRLFYLKDKITIEDGAGHICKSGTTIITSTIHPVLTIFAALYFFRCLRKGRKFQWTDVETGVRRQLEDDVITLKRASYVLEEHPTWTFFETNRSLDFIRPLPYYYKDDSPNGNMMGKKRDRGSLDSVVIFCACRIM
ncbi:hypothetical protein H0H92_013978, partial [Tricholoma furcatifolium]